MEFGLRCNLIEFKLNWKEMGYKLVENILKIFSWMQCWKYTNSKRHLSMPLHLRNGLKKFQFGIIQSMKMIYGTWSCPTSNVESLSLKY